MDTNAEAFVSGECPTPSRQARCGQRRNAWEQRGRMSDTEPSGEVRATPQCVERHDNTSDTEPPGEVRASPQCVEATQQRSTHP